MTEADQICFFLFFLIGHYSHCCSWVDRSGHSTGTSAEILRLFFLFFSDVGSVEGLAYHRPWDTLYWTSSTTSTISRQTLDQSRAGAFSRQAVVTLSEEDHPHVLALDECQKSVAPLRDTCRESGKARALNSQVVQCWDGVFQSSEWIWYSPHDRSAAC